MCISLLIMKRILLIFTLILSLINAGFAQWEKASNGLLGGNINVLFNDPETSWVYAGTSYGGILVSTDVYYEN